MSLDKLYDSVIRKHNGEPYHFKKIDNCLTKIEAYNFICGDRFDLCIQWDGEVIQSIFFNGFGCAVSKASASVLAQSLEGKSREEAKEVCSQFLRVINHQTQQEEKIYSDEFTSFVVVHEVPARYDCAALAWVEMEKYLGKPNQSLGSAE